MLTASLSEDEKMRIQTAEGANLTSSLLATVFPLLSSPAPARPSRRSGRTWPPTSDHIQLSLERTDWRETLGGRRMTMTTAVVLQSLIVYGRGREVSSPLPVVIDGSMAADSLE